jgi:hypothetical protein
VASTRTTAGLASLAVALVLGLAACGDDGDKVSTGAVPATTTSTISTTTTAATTTTTVATTAPAATSTTTVGGPAVTVLDARPGAGSGEIELVWDGVVGAVGYRVERADDPSGPFEESASIDAVTGATSTGEGVVFVSAPHADQTSFLYVEYGEAPRRYLRVVAVHPAGDAAPSVVVCGAPPGLPDC